MAIINMRIGSVTNTDWIWQSKTVTPTGQAIYVKADDNYTGLSTVVVTGDSDLRASNIKSGVTIYGVTGVY